MLCHTQSSCYRVDSASTCVWQALSRFTFASVPQYQHPPLQRPLPPQYFPSPSPPFQPSPRRLQTLPSTHPPSSLTRFILLSHVTVTSITLCSRSQSPLKKVHPIPQVNTINPRPSPHLVPRPSILPNLLHPILNIQPCIPDRHIAFKGIHMRPFQGFIEGSIVPGIKETAFLPRGIEVLVRIIEGTLAFWSS